MVDMDSRKKNFLEVKGTDEANEVDLTIFRLEKYSESRDAWLFVRRQR